LQGPSITYNAPVAWRIVGDLDKVAFAQALQALLQRHESLRTTIGLVDQQPVQIIREREAVALTTVDLQPALQALSAPEQATQVQAFLQQVAARSFDLQRECPIRLTLVTLGPEEHLFVVNLHHIVIDGWSLQRFVQELSALYAAFLHQESAPLPPLPIQYADFAAWQRTWLQGDVLAEKLAYWQTHLTAANGAPPESSALVRGRTLAARQRQLSRQAKSNAELGAGELKHHAPMNEAAARFLARDFEHYRLNPRSYHRVVKLARTIADLAVEEVLREEHVTEALSLRRLEISAAAAVGNPR
jgi:hypothetical protein